MNMLAGVVAAAAWVSVTPQTIHQEVPLVQPSGAPGAVQSPDWLRSKPVQACPIVEDGKVVGVRLCEVKP